MSTATFPLRAWNLELQADKAKVAAESARLRVVQTHRLPKFIFTCAQFALYVPFLSVTRNTEKLVRLLEEVEKLPSAILLEEDGQKIPQVLDDLFKKMCSVVQQSEALGLHEGSFLKGKISRLTDLSDQVHGFAVRYEDSQRKLRSRVPADQIADYQDSFAAYRACDLVPDQANEDDVTRGELLRF